LWLPEFVYSIADYNKGIELNPGHSLAYNVRGIDFYAERDYDRALADYSKTLEFDPKEAHAYFYPGSSFQGSIVEC